jgi:hypothetical protein
MTITGGTSLYVSNDASVFFVFKLNAAPVTGAILFGLNGINGREIDISTGSPQYLQCRNGLFCGIISGSAIPLNSYLAIGSTRNGINLNEIWNGDLIGSISTATGGNYDYSGGLAPNNGSLGHANLDTDITEVMFFNTALTQNEVDKVFCYLRAKYNLTSTTTSCGI